MTALRLLTRQLRADVPVLLTVGLLVFASAVLAAVVPRQLNATLDEALATTVAEAPAPAREVRATTLAAISSIGIQTVDKRITDAAAPTLGRALQPASRVATTDAFFTLDPGTGRRFFPREQSWLRVRYQSQLADRVRWVQGQAPLGPGRLSTSMGRVPLIDVALPDTAAATMGIVAGQQILLTPIPDRNLSAEPIAIRVTGIFAPLDTAAAYWSQDRYLLTPGEERDAYGQLVAYLGVAVTSDEESLDFLLAATTALRYEWHYPVALQGSTSDRPEVLSAAIEDLESARIDVPRAPAAKYSVLYPRVDIQSGLPEVLQDYRDEEATARAVSSLMLVGLVVIAIAVLVIAARLSVDRRGAAIALARARGCSVGQVTCAFLLLALLIAVPTAGAGHLARSFVILNERGRVDLGFLGGWGGVLST